MINLHGTIYMLCIYLIIFILLLFAINMCVSLLNFGILFERWLHTWIMSSGEGNLLLGIDIGTTSVKVCLVDPKTRQITSKQSKDTQANVPSDLGSEGNKQDVPKIISALNSCVSRLPKDQLKQVRCEFFLF